MKRLPCSSAPKQVSFKINGDLVKKGWNLAKKQEETKYKQLDGKIPKKAVESCHVPGLLNRYFSK